MGGGGSPGTDGSPGTGVSEYAWAAPASALRGVVASPALITHDGRQPGVQVGLSPLGARALLGMPAGELASTDVEGTEILGRAAHELHERLRNAVSELAERVGRSPRYLQRRLLAETGLTPKAAARVARFDRTRRRLQRMAGAGHTPALADLAAACGYYDQAHLAREFRELASCPPAAWLAEEFRNVQASPDALEEGSQA